MLKYIARSFHCLQHGEVNMIEVGVVEVLKRSSDIQDVKLDLSIVYSMVRLT